MSRDTVLKMLSYSTPPGYQRRSPVRRPKLDPFVQTIDRWLDEDVNMPRKQHHTPSGCSTGCATNAVSPAAARSSSRLEMSFVSIPTVEIEVWGI
jgi:hypothetical protein